MDQANPSKCSQWANDNGFAAVGGGFAATPDAAGNTKKEGSTSPLSEALVLKANFIDLLSNASRLFLTPLAESALR